MKVLIDLEMLIQGVSENMIDDGELFGTTPAQKHRALAA
jgi:hypothetical protein